VGDPRNGSRISAVRDHRTSLALAPGAAGAPSAWIRAAAPGEQSLPVCARGADSLVSDFAIRVDRLGKRYRIGERERYRALRDTLADAVKAPLRRLRSPRTQRVVDNTIWALRDVSLEVAPGEVLGVIGHK